MAKKSKPFMPEFRRQMIELVRSGHSPESLAKEFEPLILTALKSDSLGISNSCEH